MGSRRYEVGAAVVALPEMEVASPEGVVTNLADVEQCPDEMAEDFVKTYCVATRACDHLKGGSRNG